MAFADSLLETLSVPRLSGTAEEASVARVIEERFRALGYGVREEAFFVDRRADRAGLVAGVGIPLAIPAAAFLFFRLGFSGLAAAAGFCIPVFLLFFAKRTLFCFLASRAKDREPPGGGIRSKNVFAEKAPDSGKSGSPLLVLMAHYDSKSQPMAGGFRIALLCAAGLILLALGLGTGFSAVFPGVGRWLFGAPFFPAYILLAAIVLALGATAKFENHSPGAQDNASGVLALLRAAEILGKEMGRPGGARVLFVATGAEEFGLTGAFALRKFSRTLPPEALHRAVLLNFDSVGTGRHGLIAEGRIAGKGERLGGVLARCAAEAGARAAKIPFAWGFLTDHMAFGGRAHAAASIVGLSGRMRWIHSRNDTADRVDRDGIERAAGIAAALFRAL